MNAPKMRAVSAADGQYLHVGDLCKYLDDLETEFMAQGSPEGRAKGSVLGSLSSAIAKSVLSPSSRELP